MDGRELTTRSVAAKQVIGLVPQDLAIYPGLTARENLAFFGRLYGLSAAGLKTRVDEVLAIIGLRECADDGADELVGAYPHRRGVGRS